MPDSEIDTSDIPPLAKEFWKNALRNRFKKLQKSGAKTSTKKISKGVLARVKNRVADGKMRPHKPMAHSA